MKVGHTAATCWYRYDEDYVPDNCMATMASSSHNDPNWYLDSRTDHITSELEQLTMHEKYNDHKQIRAANGASMDIVHIGNTVLPTSSHPLHLNNVLHVPHVNKQLVSIHYFNIDNNTFIKLQPLFFLIKDQVSRKVLLHGPYRGSLYPLPCLPHTTEELLLSAIKPSSHRRHCRLGHPSRDIV
jgi:hypothetical protein